MMTVLIHNLRLKLLSLALAVMLWFVVVWERPAEQDFAARPVYTVPAGFVIKGPLPPTFDFRATGPKILLMRLGMKPLTVRLDLAAATSGAVTFTNLDRLLTLPADVKVVRIQPERITINLERKL